MPLVYYGVVSKVDFGSASFYAQTGKRAFDIVVSAALLILFAPLFLIIAALVSLDGASPFFSHRRVGLGGMPFPCYKFRSMVMDSDARLAQVLATNAVAAEEWARDQKLTDDPRVTPIGNVLRRTSLDELPQLLNVLRGEMSLVGPRPVTEDELLRYGAFVRHYLAIRPGLTGLWQVSGRNELSYEERVRLDVRYADRITFLGDLFILFRTAVIVLMMTGR